MAPADSRVATQSAPPWSAGWWAEQLGGSWPLRTFVRVVRSPTGAAGFTLVLLFVVAGVAAPVIGTHNPLQQYPGFELHGPSTRFWFGTDEFGRDLFSRVLYGIRASLLISIVAVWAGGLAGVAAGLVAGYAGGYIDSLIMRLVDTMLALPGLILAIGILAAFGVGLQSVAIALGIGVWPHFARLARGQMLSERSRDYVLAARAMGASDFRIIFRHISLNAAPPLLVQAALAMAGAVAAEAALDFLGIGTVAPAASLGSLINDGRSNLNHPYMLIFPAIALGIYLLGLTLLADATNDALDPQRKRR